MNEPSEQALVRSAVWADESFPGKSLRYRNQLAAQWLRGYYGEPNPYAQRRGANFAAGLRDAYDAGEETANKERES